MPHDAPPIDTEAARRLARELAAGEELLWAGRPSALRLAAPWWSAVCGAILALWLFGLRPLASFLRSGSGVELWFLLTTLLIALLMAAPALTAYIRGRGTIYGLTDRRGIILTPRLVGGTSARSFTRRETEDLRVARHWTGRDDVYFKQSIEIASGSGRSIKLGPWLHREGFLRIRTGREVEALVRRTLLVASAEGRAQSPAMHSRPTSRGVSRDGSESPPPAVDVTVAAAGLPPELRRCLEAELCPDERIVWLGRPRPLACARRQLWVGVFGLGWTAFSALFVVAPWLGLTEPEPGKPDISPQTTRAVFVIGGSLFVCIGLWLTGFPWRAARDSKRTLYVLSDRRALVFKAKGKKRYVRSFGGGQLHHMDREQHRDGSGDIIFSRFSEGNYPDQEPPENDLSAITFGFLGIDNVGEVERLIRDTLVDEPGIAAGPPRRTTAMPVAEIGLPEDAPGRVVRQALQPGEVVLWHGSPEPSLRLRNHLMALVCGLGASAHGIIFSAIAARTAVDPSFSNVDEDQALLTVLFMSLGGAVGLSLGLWLTLYAAGAPRRARRTHYVVTDRGTIIARPRFTRGVVASRLAPEQLDRTWRIERPGGRGDIILHDKREQRRGFFDVFYRPDAFYAIDDPAGVERLILDFFVRRA